MDHNTLHRRLLEAAENRALDIGQAWNLLAEAAVALAAQADVRPRWRHLKRGSTYVEIGRGEVQSSKPIAEGETLVAYRAHDGRLWFRPASEFDDGRFVRIDPEGDAA